MSRYIVMQKSITSHCCFVASVLDTTKPQNYRDECGWHYDPICECFSLEDAKTVCDALNNYEKGANQ